MIIKVFKITTMEMWTLRHKKGLMEFIEQEVDVILPSSFTINDMIKYLPKENYCRVK